MGKRKARKLYWQAVASYEAGYIDGASARDDLPTWATPDPEDRPAYAAGFALGQEGTALRRGKIPLDVWVRVLANEAKP